MKACFIGHKSINKTEELATRVKDTALMLIKKGVTTFLFGSGSEFDTLSWEIITELKKKYSHIKRVYIRANDQFLEKSYEEYLLKIYEETYFPRWIENAGKYSYVERNYEMINEATYCVFYYNENYSPTVKRVCFCVPSKRKSGTKIAYEYALKKGKYILNVYR